MSRALIFALACCFASAAWADSAQQASSVSVQAGNSAATAANGTFTVTWATPFAAAPAVMLNVFSNGAAAPQVTSCQVDSTTTTSVSGHCSSTQTSTVGALGAVISPVAAAAGVIVSAVGVGRTQ